MIKSVASSEISNTEDSADDVVSRSGPEVHGITRYAPLAHLACFRRIFIESYEREFFDGKGDVFVRSSSMKMYPFSWFNSMNFLA